MDWQHWRKEFPGLARSTYLNSCSLGALSTRVRAAVLRHLDLWESDGASAWYGPWLAETVEARKAFAALIGAREDEVALFPNVSSALAVVQSGLVGPGPVPGPGQRARHPGPAPGRHDVVATDMDFPTQVHAFVADPRLRVSLAKGDGVRVDPAAVEALLSERTAALVTSHVLFASGQIQDVRRLCGAASRVGALSIVDAYQATGQVPTDVKQIGCDVLVTGGLKWLLGGTGIAYLYVRREARERLHPTIAGWFGHARQFDFDATTWERRDDARGLEMGTPALSSVFAGRAGLDIVREIGPERIRARSRELCDDLADRLRDRGFGLLSPMDGAERAGIVCVASPDPWGDVARLRTRGTIVDARPGRVRISPYFYNTPEENETFVDAFGHPGSP
ncbi:MAG TPA: aminotransferase class V-fold PLP-dependent enzyme [Candidatus Thermoplasmatota archaeon]|nr:aminotransferase class V-fold PLP-dependent enzyme [Candidatus Thermoplasmatota archaeon]